MTCLLRLPPSGRSLRMTRRAFFQQVMTWTPNDRRRRGKARTKTKKAVMEGEDTMGRGYPGARWTLAKLNRAIWKKYVTTPMHLQRGVLWLCVYVDFGDGESLRTHMTERKYQSRVETS